jgi:hypothetical protein
MRKHYIQLATTIQQINPVGSVCIGSVHGNAGLEFGGGSDGTNDEQKPF